MSIDDLARDIAAKAPKVSQHIDASGAEKADTGPQKQRPKFWTDKKDKYGRAFDPELLHDTYPDGRPKINKSTGTLKLKPGAPTPSQQKAKAASQPVTDKGGFVGDPAATAGQQPVADPAGQSGIVAPSSAGFKAASSVFLVGQIALDAKQWQPMPDELEGYAMDWTAFLASHGMVDIPPGWALLISSFAIVASRAITGPTHEKIVAIIDRIYYAMNPQQTIDVEQTEEEAQAN